MKKQQGRIVWAVLALLVIAAIATWYLFPPASLIQAVKRMFGSTEQVVSAPLKKGSTVAAAPAPVQKPPVQVLPPDVSLRPAPPPATTQVAQAAEAPAKASPASPKDAAKISVKPKASKPKASPKRTEKSASKARAAAPAASTVSAQGGEWRNWGSAPYAQSFEEACRKMTRAIDGFTRMPSAVRGHFKQTLGSDCSGGKEVWLTPHQRLKEMWSGPDGLHKGAHIMVDKEVAELPVPKSPDGRAYRKGSVAEAAKALEWTYEHEGVTYHLVLPYVCFNWAWWSGAPVPKSVTTKPQDCAYVVHFTRSGDTGLRQMIVGPTPVQDPCLATLRPGDKEWRTVAVHECTTSCSFSSALNVVRQGEQWSNDYVPQPGMHVIRVPRWMTEEGSRHRVLLCLEQGSVAGGSPTSSDVRDVRWEHYRLRSTVGMLGARTAQAEIAIVYYDEVEHRKAWYEGSHRGREPALWWSFGEYAKRSKERALLEQKLR